MRAGGLRRRTRNLDEERRAGQPGRLAHDHGEAPGDLPPLRDDQIVLRRALDERHDPAVEVLVAETDLIVSGVEKVAGILAP